MVKKKDVAEIFAENIFKDSKFQEKWQGYLVRFGADIDNLFSESYKAKVQIAAVLQKICDGNYEEALHCLKSYYVTTCSTDEEKNIINRLIVGCEKNILPEMYPKQSERYMQYRDKLLSAGFSEAKQHYGRFFRRTTENVAFIINLDDEEYGVSVLYGFASTLSLGDADWFENNGSYNEDCQVRNILLVCDDIGEVEIAETISDFYAQYKDYSKDEILALKKERQKAFLSHFAVALKPLGFKKKGTKWTKDLRNGTALSFEAQKSAYSDQYYFNVSVHDISDFYARQTYERVVVHDSQIYNWQLMSEDQIENLIQYTLTNYIKPKLENL